MSLRILAVGVLLSMTGAAFAADLPTTKGPPPSPSVAPPPQTDWSGIYGELGLGWGGDTRHWTYLNPGPATLTPFNASSDSVAGLAVVGAQKQFGNFVIGAEAGLAGLLTSDYAGPASNGTATSVCTSVLGERCQSKLDSAIVMVGPKLGFAADNWLFYGVGGAAWSDVASRVVVASGAVFDTAGGPVSGWYLGAGVDYDLVKLPNYDVVVGLEYRHAQFESKNFNSSADGGPSPPGANGRRLGADADMVLATIALKFDLFR